MDYKKIITGLLSKTYKLDDGEVATLLESGDNITEETILEQLLSKDTERVTALKKATDTTGKFQEGYAKAKKEERANFEKEIKEKFGIESDNTGLELVDTIVSEKSAEAGKGKKGEVTEDDVKKHPVYQNLESRAKKEIADKAKEFNDKYTQLEQKQKRGETFATIKAKAMNLLDGLKPVLPGNTDVANNIKGLFLGALDGFDYELQGDRAVILKDGKVMEDKHGNSMELEDLVKTTASKFFEFQKNNGGENPGAGDGGTGGSGGDAYPTGINKPKNLEELSKITNDSTIKLADRQKVMEVYKKENATS